MSAESSGAAENVRRAFASLSVDDKISTLIRIELDMIGDAVECVVSATSKAIDDIAKACCQTTSEGTEAGQPSAS